MSDLLVLVVKIDEVHPHPNADKLEIVKVGGWQIVSGKGNYVVGQLAVHVPPDVMVPKDWAIAWGVRDYLSWKKDATKGRVKAVKLRGAPSFGFLAPVPGDDPIGTNLAEYLGIEKYEEPESTSLGQMVRNHPLFHTYTDIQNLRNFPDQLNYGAPLILTEKIHGTNSRVGWVRSSNEIGNDYLEKVAGTHRTQRKIEQAGVYGLPFELYDKGLNTLYDILTTTSVPGHADGHVLIDSILVFGEIFGPGVQDLTYGKEKAWRIFDIAINGTYLPWAYVKEICVQCELPIVPHINPTVYTFKELCELAEGDSVLSPGQIKEGIVVRPMDEETWGKGDLDPHPKRRIFKVISHDYLTRKGGTERH